jgi:hypothetical protein
MSKTAVGLFESSTVADQVIHDLEASGFPGNEIRTLAQPRAMAAAGAMSTPHIDFEVSLGRELKQIGATTDEANLYVEGVRRGGVLVFATGSDEETARAAGIMNRHGAIGLEKLVGHEPSTAFATPSTSLGSQDSTQTGRIRQDGDGARLFVW